MQQPPPQFDDRLLLCADCQGEFIFTAGEQLFFHDKQFKNDPKRCKPCKSRRSGLSAAAAGGTSASASAGFSRTETRTECSECGIETTVPFKPTQGRPVLCRQCFQAKGKAGLTVTLPPDLATASAESTGEHLSLDAATLAAASVLGAPADSSVATPEEVEAVLEMQQ